MIYNKWEDKDYIDYVIKGWTESRDNSHRNDLYNIIRKNYTKGMKLLDAGCGVGFDYPVIKRIVGNDNYIGFDISENMIKTAKERNPDGNFEIGDVTRIKFKPYSFDIVVCSSVIRHMENYEQVWAALGQLVRVSKKVVIIVHMLTDSTTQLNRENPLSKERVTYMDWIINKDEFVNNAKSFGCKCNINWTITNAKPPIRKAIIEVFK